MLAVLDGFQLAHPARGCDNAASPVASSCLKFQLAHPARGCDDQFGGFVRSKWQFQLAHPARGCDSWQSRAPAARNCFNSRTPRGGATNPSVMARLTGAVSTRAPREGVRPQATCHAVHDSRFQLAHPARGCDPHITHIDGGGVLVSTRAPREGVRRGGDGLVERAIGVSTRAPREGVRLAPLAQAHPSLRFQLAHPARGCDWILMLSIMV